MTNESTVYQGNVIACDQHLNLVLSSPSERVYEDGRVRIKAVPNQELLFLRGDQVSFISHNNSAQNQKVQTPEIPED